VHMFVFGCFLECSIVWLVPASDFDCVRSLAHIFNAARVIVIRQAEFTVAHAAAIG